MRLGLKSIFGALVFLTIAFSLAYSQTIELTGLVDRFKQATDLERQQIIRDSLGKDTQAGGIVANAEEYNFFNEKTDVVTKYYRAVTEVQVTGNNTAYQVVFLYKDIDKIKDLKKGQALAKEGKIIKIIDERLQVCVWLADWDLNLSDF